MNKRASSALTCGIVGDVLSIIGIFAFGWLGIVGLILGICAVINGSKVKSESGAGLAGFILGVVDIPLGAVITVLYILTLMALFG